jgi:hypothetical protein
MVLYTYIYIRRNLFDIMVLYIYNRSNLFDIMVLYTVFISEFCYKINAALHAAIVTLYLSLPPLWAKQKLCYPH